jgi:hypothetical protein
MAVNPAVKNFLAERACWDGNAKTKSRGLPRGGSLPFECGEKLPGEGAASFAAFCAFRDYGPDRNIKRAVEKFEADESKRGRRYRVWRLWSNQFQWFKRASEYDVYPGKLKQAERRKTIEAREEAYREVTVFKRTMNREQITKQGCGLQAPRFSLFASLLFVLCYLFFVIWPGFGLAA